MRLTNSISARITLFFAVMSAVTMIAIGAVASYLIEEHFAEEDLNEINGKLELIQNAFNQVTKPTDLEKLPRALSDALVGHHALAVVVSGSEGRPLFQTPHAHFPEDILAAEPAGRFSGDMQKTPYLHKWKIHGEIYRGLTTQLKTAIPNAEPLQVAIAIDIAHHERFIAHFQQALWLYLLIGILFMALTGWWATKRGLAPIHDFVRLAGHISTSRLNDRIETEPLPLELINLGRSFNAMLERLQEAFVRLSEFSSDIAHELRTPVSNLMTESHVALSQVRSIEEYKEILYSNIEEYERLARIIADMLFLAKADNGLIVPNGKEMNLGDEIDAVVEYYEAPAAEKDIAVVREGSAKFTGDALMMRRAFSNLLSNAIRHTPVRGQILITVSAEAQDNITIRFKNPGMPIPTEALTRIFDRFYRVDPARQRETEGTGLGLPITKSIIESHGGSINAFNVESGVCLEIRLPKMKG